MRVLHLSESADGGLGVAVAALVTAQRESGHSVTVLAPTDGPGADRLRAAASAVVHWDVGPRPGPRLGRELRAAARVIREVDPDLVQLHSSKAGLVGRLLVRGRRPTLFQPHAWSWYAVEGPVRRATLAWERAAARWCDAVVCVSADEERLGRAAGIRARYVSVPQGVDLERHRAAGPEERAAARVAAGLPATAPIAACLGRLHRQKGQTRLVALWPRVRDRVPEGVLVLVGEGPDRARLEAAAGGGVVFAGHSPAPERYLRAADVVVQPSRWEGLSLTVLEAMATARSLVVTDVPGMAEAVAPGTGAVVAADDDDALVEAVVRRLTEAGLADEEGRVARRAVERDHDLRDALAAYLTLAERTVAQRTPIRTGP
jgi:glycosyltransferase involved in cell wall biosynthesis